MLKYIFLICLLSLSIKALTQSDWIDKNIGSGIHVKFPNDPSYKVKDKSGTYTSTTQNNLFIVVVMYDVLPRYSDFVKLPAPQQDGLINVFLDNAVNAMLTASGNTNGGYHIIKLGDYKGRETSYEAINPQTGNMAKKFSKLIYAYNKAFIFQCMSLKEDQDAKKEKDYFLNSITSN